MLKFLARALAAVAIAVSPACAVSKPDLPNRFDIRNYGAVAGDGADDTTAINSAISARASAGGGEVALPPGTWKATGQIVLQDGVTLSGAGMDKTVLDCTTTTASTAHVLGQGSIAALANQFTTNIPANGRAIKFSASPGVTTGDLLLLYNSADYSFSGARSYYRAGEFARVSKCFGTTTNGSNQLTSVSHASSFTTGQAVAGTGIPEIGRAHV